MRIEVFGKFVEIDEELLRIDEKRIKRDIGLYLAGKLRDFGYKGKIKYDLLPPELVSLIKALLTVPYGRTITYGELGKLIDMTPRKVGKLCGKNPLPIIVPCHRVVGSRDLGGYSYGRELKKLLLELEKNGNGGPSSKLNHDLL